FALGICPRSPRGWPQRTCGLPHEWKWGLLLPGAPEPRLPLLRRQDFRSVFQTASRGLSNRSIVVVGNYESGPITAAPCRATARPLRPRRSCFAPAGAHRSGWARVEAPGTAPGSERFITTAIYRHSRLAPAPRNIGVNGCRKKTGEAAANCRNGAPQQKNTNYINDF